MRLSTRRLRFLVRALLLLAAAAAVLILLADRLPSALLVAPELRSAKSVLWVIAHPDDESFFFAPSILGLLGASAARQGSLLCLSVGNHDGLGEVRRRELRDSCQQLGLERERCEVLDVPALPDDPQVWWETSDVEAAARRYIKQWSVDAIISFDAYGVSGHANHRATSEALRDIALRDPLFPPSFAVSSTNVLAKFTSALLLPLACFKRGVAALQGQRGALFVNSWAQYWQARRSFAAHASQARWFRTLFVSFSGYMWYVELERVA
ncbi:hypothetical protein JCM10213_007736 [Rhodosporidiobolus nylandii]